MEDNQLAKIAKEAYVLAQQIAGMEEAMNRGKEAVSGYSSYAKNFNSILEKSRRILKLDKTILGTVKHLTPYDDNKRMGYLKDFEEIKGNLPILKAALQSFFDFHFPKKQKEKIGFK